MEISKEQRTKIQAAMFKSIYDVNDDLPNEERFIKAIICSCDEEFEKALRKQPERIKEYLLYLDECEAYKINEQIGQKGNNEHTQTN